MKKKQIKIEGTTLFVYRLRKNSKNAAPSTDPTTSAITTTKTSVV